MSNVYSFETYVRTSRWGTFGKGGVEHCMGRCPEHQLRFKRLLDCDTDHLQMILKNQRQVEQSPFLKSLIHHILIERDVTPERFSPEAEAELFEQCAAATRNFPYVVQSPSEGTNAARQEG